VIDLRCGDEPVGGRTPEILEDLEDVPERGSVILVVNAEVILTRFAAGSPK
jgi:hypothetical protein